MAANPARNQNKIGKQPNRQNVRPAQSRPSASAGRSRGAAPVGKRPQASPSYSQPIRRPSPRTVREPGIFMRGFTALYQRCRRKMSGLQAVLFLAGILYLLFALLYFGGKIRSFYGNTERLDSVTYITVNPEKPSETVSTVATAKNAYRGENFPYINLSEIAGETGLMTIGNSKQIRLILADNANASALFRNGDIHVVIGDTTVTLPAPVQIVNQTVYVPYQFFADYVSGYETAFDPATNELRLLRQTDPALSTEDQPVFLPLQYTIHPNQTLEPIQEVFPDEQTSETAQ